MKKIIFASILLSSFTTFTAQKTTEVSDKDQMTWYHKDFSQTNVHGVNTQNAIKYLESKGLKPNNVLVAVLDSGVEVDHPGLIKNMWKNPNEVPNNGKDDDGNGYIDDIHGWNFLGGKNGEVEFDTLEKTRVVKKYQSIFEGTNSTSNKANQQKFPQEFETYMKAKKEFVEESTTAKQNFMYYSAFIKDIPVLVGLLNGKNFTPENVGAIKPVDAKQSQYLYILNSLLKDDKLVGKSSEELKKGLEEQFNDAVKYFDAQANYQYNLDYNSRTIVGDNEDNMEEKSYGNNHYEGPDAEHGTHVAGIIAGYPNSDNIQYGVASKVAKIMTVRTVPNGDERDKDVANAIKYAVDNGAKILNMSFGKSYSPNKEIVWNAMKYAENKNVLLVHAAGNDNKDLGVEDNFPTNFYEKSDDKSFVNNVITIGASTNDPEFLRADFSNYNRKMVDVFAPGTEIYSTVPDAKYKYQQGTSMAAPVVSGAAAILLAYMPNLKPNQIIEALVNSANKSSVNAMLPSNTDNRFDLISKAGGVADLRKAAEYAFTKFYSVNKNNTTNNKTKTSNKTKINKKSKINK